MKHSLEFFFDCSSPWTYLAFENIQRELSGCDYKIDWKPILVGGVFNSVNPSVYASRENPVPSKAAYLRKDLNDWAAYSGVEIGWPDVFPVNSVKAMRGACWAIEKDILIDYARLVFSKYWGELKDISNNDVLRELTESIGLDSEEFFEAISTQKYKDALRANTEELIDRGGFGSPTIFINGNDMYFGNDRIALIRHKISS